MHAIRHPFLLLLTSVSILSACGPGPDSELSQGLAYSEALAAVAAQPEQASTLCAAVTEPDLHADCVTAAVERLGDAELGGSLCASLPEGAGRDECVFQLAESSGQPGLCDGAGRYADDCKLHLWTATLLQELPREARPAQAEALIPPLLEGHAFEDGDGRPWVAVYRMLMGARRPFDRALCDEIPHEERRQICRDASRDLYQDLLNRARDRDRFPCDGSPLPSELVFTPDPELEALIERRRTEDLCPPPR